MNGATEEPNVLDATDLDAERRYLGAALLNPQAVSDHDLDPQTFFREEHRAVYRTLVEAVRRGVAGDDAYASVTSLVRATFPVDEAVKITNLMASLLPDAEPLEAVDATAALLKDLSIRRRIIRLPYQIERAISATPDTARLTSRISALTDFATRREEPTGPTPSEVSSPLVLTSLTAGLATPDVPTDYVVDGLLNVGGTSCLSGPFKGGKSTLLRVMCVAVADGVDFLARGTKPCNVGYISLEEDKQAVKEHFRLLSEMARDPTARDRIFYEVGDQWLPAKLDEKIDLLEQVIDRHSLGLLVLGPLQDFFGFRNINDYSEVKPALRAFTNKVARTTGCHVIFDHHNNKYGSGRAAFLGSVAIGGGVDQLLTLTVVEDEKGQVTGRGLTTWQRYGESILSLLGLDFVPNRLETSLGPPPERLKDQAGLQQLAMRITALCQTWTTAKVIEETVGGNKQHRIDATNWAVEQGMLARRPRKAQGGGYEYLESRLLEDDPGTSSRTSSEEE